MWLCKDSLIFLSQNYKLWDQNNTSSRLLLSKLKGWRDSTVGKKALALGITDPDSIPRTRSGPWSAPGVILGHKFSNKSWDPSGGAQIPNIYVYMLNF